jgi:hypothetical protein
MRWRRHSDRQTGRPSEEAGQERFRVALWAILIAGLLSSGVAAMASALTIDIGPAVGDILVFRPGASMPGDLEFSAHSAAAPAQTCLLHPKVMAANGGSLVVEERLERPRTYRVHWAGNRTTNGTGDCGGDADLVLGRLDLQLLSNTVGGPGVTPRLFNAF